MDGPKTTISPYRSWEELRADNVEVVFNDDYTERLFWYLDGDFDGEFPANISVAPVPRIEENLEPLFDYANGGKWHEIAELPLTKPPVSSIDISCYELEVLEYCWTLEHREWCDEGEYVSPRDLSAGPRPISTPGEEREAQEIGDEFKYLMRCCGENRPVGRTGLKVNVTPSPEKDFITIRDFLATVQPWLRSHYDDIMAQKKYDDEDKEGRPEAIWWMVVPGATVELARPDIRIRR